MDESNRPVVIIYAGVLFFAECLVLGVSMTWYRRAAGLVLAAPLCLMLCTAAVAAERHHQLAPGERMDIQRGGFGYTLEVLSPLTQSWPVIDFFGPYYYIALTNTSASQDSFLVENINEDVPFCIEFQVFWFDQVCLRQQCWPDMATLPFAPGETDTIGVQMTVQCDGFGNWDFRVTSLSDPSLTDTFYMELYAGAAAVAAPALGGSLDGFELRQNSPNPMRGSTAISFVLPRAESVHLGIYDVTGRLVTSLENGSRAAGSHTVTWDGHTSNGAAVPSGVYFYRLETSQGDLSKQMTLIRQ